MTRAARPWSTSRTKRPRVREAEASAFVAMSREVLRALPKNPKGDPLEVARIAGIMAAKKTADLIPMCHPLPLSKIEVYVEVQSDGIAIHTLVRTTAETGVEMEALVAASVAALTVYDMCKALDKGIEIRDVVAPAQVRRQERRLQKKFRQEAEEVKAGLLFGCCQGGARLQACSSSHHLRNCHSRPEAGCFCPPEWRGSAVRRTAE